jgi:flagellar biogenesis protein FliO
MALEFGRMLLALGLVLGLLWVCSKVGQGRQHTGRGRSAPGADSGKIEVMGRRSLGRHTSITVVRAAGRIMVVGQTPQQISVLVETVQDPGVGDGEGYRTDGGMPAAAMPETGEDLLLPGLAATMGTDTPRAWDAFVERLREMTVRH